MTALTVFHIYIMYTNYFGFASIIKSHLPTLTSRGQSFFLATAPISDTGWARSGVKGPLMWGFSYTTESNKHTQYSYWF